jgi:hypothetical protein
MLWVVYKCGRLIPAYRMGPNTTAHEVFRLKCSFDKVAQIVGDCIFSHSDLVSVKAGRENPTFGI